MGTPHDQTLKAVAVATLGQEEDGLHAGSLGKDFKSSQKDSNYSYFPFCARAYWVRFKTTFQVLPILSRVSHSVSQFEEVANAVLLPISHSSLIHPKDPGSLSLLQHVVKYLYQCTVHQKDRLKRAAKTWKYNFKDVPMYRPPPSRPGLKAWSRLVLTTGFGLWLGAFMSRHMAQVFRYFLWPRYSGIFLWPRYSGFFYGPGIQVFFYGPGIQVFFMAQVFRFFFQAQVFNLQIRFIFKYGLHSLKPIVF